MKLHTNNQETSIVYRVCIDRPNAPYLGSACVYSFCKNGERNTRVERVLATTNEFPYMRSFHK